MNEAETRAELIAPALAAAGWGKVDGSRVRCEVIAPGRLIGGGKRSKPEIADYVLLYRGQKLAVIEAKRLGLGDTEGLAQAKRYATRLQTRFAYSTNGRGIYRVDMQTGQEGYVSGYPAPAALEAIAENKGRIMLTLATGTGKTFIAFQLAWKLFHSRWNLKDWNSDEEPRRRPRILFLADRNILADQA